MKKHNGGLGNFLNEITQTSEKNPHEEKIVYIDIDDLEENPKNFYGLRDIDSLAGLISVSNLIEPLIVRKNSSGKYTIISGHRRRAAVRKLLDEGIYTNKKLPCIVKDSKKFSIEQKNGEIIEFDEDAVEMLNLIASNRGQREERTIEEKLQEVKYLEDFARAIYNQKTWKNRGRFLNFFAEEILNISKSQLHRINSMAKLTAQVKEALNEKKISEGAAVEISNLPPKEQNLCLSEILRGNIGGTVSDIQNWQQAQNSISDENGKEKIRHSLIINFRYERRILGEDIEEKKSAEEWLEDVSKDFYKKLHEVVKNISRSETDKSKASKWRKRAALLKKHFVQKKDKLKVEK